MAWSLGQCREWLGIRALHLSRTQELGWHALPKIRRIGQGGSLLWLLCCGVGSRDQLVGLQTDRVILAYELVNPSTAWG